ncbi:hypothetical protein A2U01_0096421, partial [Trifolium medium]|nr:hypothetical protein [Trifolium medium]
CTGEGGGRVVEMASVPFCMGGGVVFEVLSALEQFFLQVDAQDRWKWYSDLDKGYSVSVVVALKT